MAVNLNRVEVVGNLTRDPEIRYTPNGKPVAQFAVATNRRYPDQTGNWIDADPEYHEVVVWDKLAEGCNRSLKKGDRVWLTGRLQTRSWEGQDGNKRSRTEIICDTIIGPDQVNRAAYQEGGPVVRPATPAATTAPATPSTPSTPTDSSASAAAPAAAPAAAAANEDEINIEDIPF